MTLDIRGGFQVRTNLVCPPLPLYHKNIDIKCSAHDSFHMRY